MADPLVLRSVRGIHRALSGEVTKLEEHAASLDPTSAEAVGGFMGHFMMTKSILAAHANDEDTAIFPMVAERVPHLVEAYQMDHEAEKAIEERIAASLGQLQAGAGDATALGRSIYRDTVAFSSHLVHHMEKEMAHLYPALGAAMTEQEQAELVGKGLRTIPKDMIQQAMPWFASYQTPEQLVAEMDAFSEALEQPEVAEFFRPMAASMPPEKLEAVYTLRPSLKSLL